MGRAGDVLRKTKRFQQIHKFLGVIVTEVIEMKVEVSRDNKNLGAHKNIL